MKPKLIKRTYPLFVSKLYRGKPINQLGEYDANDQFGFVSNMFQLTYKILKEQYPLIPEKRRVNLATWITTHKAAESGYGSRVANGKAAYNYGGYGGPRNPVSFDSMESYISRFLSDATTKYPGIFKANNLREYSDALFTENYGYNPRDNLGSVVSDPKKYDRRVSQDIYFNGIPGKVTGLNGMKSVLKYIKEFYKQGINKTQPNAKY